MQDHSELLRGSESRQGRWQRDSGHEAVPSRQLHVRGSAQGRGGGKEERCLFKPRLTSENELVYLFGGEANSMYILSVSQIEAPSRFLQSVAVVKLQVCLGYFKYSNFSIFENNSNKKFSVTHRDQSDRQHGRLGRLGRHRRGAAGRCKQNRLTSSPKVLLEKK